MAIGRFEHVKIGGISVALPTRCYDTEELATDMDERAIRRFVKATGVKKRYLSCKGQATSDLCFVAAEKIFERLDIDRKEIDACIFISQNPDYKRPSTAIVLQERLKLEKKCVAFDINLGCSGYVYGIYIIAGLLESGAIRKALLLAGDVNRDLDGELLFGDGGSATLLEYSEKTSIVEGLMRSDGSGYTAIYTPKGGQRQPLDEANPDWMNAKPQMKGAEVFEFTITQVPQLLKDFIETFHKTWEDYDYVILHQANMMVLKNVIGQLNIPSEKAPFSIQDYGNVSSASVPIAIVDLCRKFSDEDKSLSLLLSGFGVGLSLGAISVELSTRVVLPITFTDYVWDEKL